MPRRKTAAQLESEYQSYLVHTALPGILPDPVIEKFDVRQGYPDLILLCEGWWGVLEVKPFFGADQQPNQDYWVTHFNGMSFGSFIWPEIEEEVLLAVKRSFQSSRHARVPQP